MIRIMLVDDNRVALEYFSGLVRWEELGYELVCTAIDGASALLLFHKYHPEVIITDVQMPNLDGIGLAREVMKLAPDTVMIFLSSYAEFSYIQSAMRYGVMDYILKHETKAPQMKEKLLSVRELLKKKKGERRFVAEGYVQKLLKSDDGGMLAKQERDGYLEYFQGKYDLTIVFQTHIPAVIRDYVEQNTPPVDGEKLKWTAYQDPQTVVIAEVAPYTYVIVSIHAKDPITESYQRKELLEKQFSSMFTLLLLCENVSMESCIQMYGKRSAQFGQAFFFAPSSVLQSSALRQATAQKEELTIKQLETLLAKEEQHQLVHALDQAFLRSIREKDLAGYERLVRVCMETLMAWEGKLIDYQRGCTFQVVEPSAVSSWLDALALFYWLKERISYLSVLMQENRSQSYSDTVRNLLVYIYAHYQESELMAEQIAADFGVGINQLNKVVKKETGYTVWKLLIKVRMEMAKKLLDTTDQKVAEISRQVGYSSIAYFSTVFRKYYMVSPQEYRKGPEEE